MRIGLLGGTFDPIHSGHLHMARRAERALDLDHIFFVVARPWQKPRVQAGFSDRFAMVALALAGKPRWQPLEIPPPARNGASYTSDEVAWLRRRFPQAAIFLLLGADAMAGIVTWKNYRRLLRQCDFAVFGREGHNFTQFLAALPAQLRPPDDVTSGLPAPASALERTDGRDRIILPGGRKLIWLSRFRDPASSSGIRARLQAGRQAPPGWLPPRVDEYIHRAPLYRKKV